MYIPEGFAKRIYNASTDPCDMVDGPCACGAWHKPYEWEIEDGLVIRRKRFEEYQNEFRT